MIALKCAHCGQHVEVNEGIRDSNISCPGCGHLVSGDHIQTVPSKPFSATEPTHEQAADEETLAPKSSRAVAEFSFLSPAREQNELGWLAHYRVTRLLGQGGMGIVFEAVDTKLQRTVAIKVMKPDIAEDPSARKRFSREAEVMASIKNDHIVVIHDVDEVNGVPFLAMEFLHGEPLDKWLELHGRPSLEETLRIGMEIARGLAAAHDLGLIHRDIKPANIWLETSARAMTTSDSAPSPAVNQPKPFRVKILDFGLARIAQEKGHLTHTGLVLGTPAYMAPEQAEGGEVDARGDLFSLGCVLYELATGAKPFSGSNTMAVLMAVAMKDPMQPLQLNPELPPALGDLVMALLAKLPQDRPASAQRVALSLQSIAGQLGLFGQTPTSGIDRAQPTLTPFPFGPPNRRKFLFTLGALGGLLALGLLAWLLFPRTIEQELLLGMSGPFNGSSKELGREMETGIKLYLRHINAHGGIHGRKLQLVALDDGYEPDQALANMKDLHEQKNVFAVIGNVGTPTAQKTVPYANANKLIFFGAFTGARILRKDPPDRYVFNYRASYEEETAKIVEYLVEIKKIAPDQIAVFDQDDGFGDAGFNGVAKIMRTKYKRDVADIFRVRYERNTSKVHEAVQGILQHPKLRAVVMVGTYKPVTEFIRQIRDANRELTFTNVSFVGSEALAEGLKELGQGYADGVIVTQVVPPIDSGASVVLKYRELLAKYFPNERPSFTSLEGYIATTVFVEGLKRAGPDPTTEKMIDALESIRDFDIGIGAPITLNGNEHQASHKVWATVLDKAGQFKVLEMAE